MTNVFLEATIAPSRPVANRNVFVLVEGLRALDGSELNGAVETRFTTAFSPFYANAMRVRLLAGEFLTEVPDDTLNQLIHYFSHQADLSNFCPESSAVNPATYRNYRSRWVTAATIICLLSGSSINAMMQKRLGDLMVKRDRAADDLARAQAEELKKLTGILEDGGNYGRGLEVAVKGVNHPDSVSPARQWASPDIYQGQTTPIANSKLYYRRISDGGVQRRGKKGYRDR